MEVLEPPPMDARIIESLSEVVPLLSDPRPHVADEQIAEALGPLFAELQTHPNPQLRGTEFERLLQRLFRLCGYDAELDSPVAHPRQTDLLARDGARLYLLEAKWQRDPIDIDDIDSFHSRLRRAPHGAIGCFFSMSSYTQSAILRAGQLRSSEHGGHELLLFDPSEVTGLMNGWSLLREGIAAKLRALRERGATLLLRDIPRERLTPLDIPFPTPAGSRANDLDAGLPGNAYNFAFGEVPSFFHRFAEEVHAFEMYGPVDISDAKELLGFLHLLHSRLRLTGRGSYTITELHNETIWFGTSASNLVTSLIARPQRYVKAKFETTHHSEEFSFYDVTRVGALFVSGRHNISTGRLYNVAFELRLPGIPLNSEPLCSLASSLGHPYHQLMAVDRPFVTRVKIPGDRLHLPARPLEYLYDVTGFCSMAIVENPFVKTGNSSRQEPLSSTSFLFGRLGDYLSEVERVRHFFVHHCDILHFRNGNVLDVWLAHDEALRYRVEGRGNRRS
jgi:Restriction endonuclease